MIIFKHYTGNAMLNNALMTIEALANLNEVSMITPEILRQLYEKVQLKDINKRLKSYTMLFTKNGPLHNDKTNGDKIYESLFKVIISNYENEGTKICEISGLKFRTSFDDFYQLALRNVGYPQKEINNKDTNIGRTWFPLIGGLGSDAQALPQAKFTVQIHPICIPILQFLPLSSLLYKGGILLIDSSNFALAKRMVADNTKILAEKIQAVSVKEVVENVRDFSKGDYLTKVLDILNEKEEFEESYSDLNMWSFSNSGTGASCAIDRVPNTLIKKLKSLYKNAKIGNELKGILKRNESAYSFIECLENNKDWFLLYPNVFGSGKKRVEYHGVSPHFLEAYFEVIDKSNLIPISKYIGGLIEKYKSKVFDKILEKTDAWNDAEYRIELFKVLVKASENKEWSLEHQISILDNPDGLPVKNNYYQLHKLIHYFYQNKISSKLFQVVDVSELKVFKACNWLVHLIQNDSKATSIKSNLINTNEYSKVGFTRIIFDALDKTKIDLEDVIEIFYDEDFNYRKLGLNELLRIFFLQRDHKLIEFSIWKSKLKGDNLITDWKNRIQDFARDYQAYYYTKNRNFETGELPHKKFIKTVTNIVKEQDDFYKLLIEMIFNTNQFIKDREQIKTDKWTVEDLMTNPLGKYSQNFCVMASKFLFKQIAFKDLKEELLINGN